MYSEDYRETLFICFQADTLFQDQEMADTQMGAIVQTKDYCHFFEPHQMSLAAMMVASILHTGSAENPLNQHEIKKNRTPLFENQPDHRIGAGSQVERRVGELELSSRPLRQGGIVVMNRHFLRWDEIIIFGADFMRHGGTDRNTRPDGLDFDFFTALIPVLRGVGVWTRLRHLTYPGQSEAPDDQGFRGGSETYRWRDIPPPSDDPDDRIGVQTDRWKVFVEKSRQAPHKAKMLAVLRNESHVVDATPDTAAVMADFQSYDLSSLKPEFHGQAARLYFLCNAFKNRPAGELFRIANGEDITAVLGKGDLT